MDVTNALTENYMIRELLTKHERLSILEFEEKFKKKRTPVIITHALDCLAMEKWNIQYFKDKYTDKKVELDFYALESPQKNQKWGTRTLKLPEALDLICNNTDKSIKHYLMQKSMSVQFPELLSDAQLPIYANKKLNYFVNLWIGESGIVSQAHYDCSDNFLTQIFGRKRVRLFSPLDSINMYPSAIDDDCLGDKTASHISQIQDTDFVNAQDFPDFKYAVCYEGIISPGDLLYIPAGWWHEVKSLETSISVNYWWKMQLFDLSNTQISDWICSTFFYFSNTDFEETLNTLFDFSAYHDDIEIAEISLSKDLPCIAAVFLLHYFNKIHDNPQAYAVNKFENEIPKWKVYLDTARNGDNALLSHDAILDIITTIKDVNKTVLGL